jgi:hypothetical protein
MTEEENEANFVSDWFGCGHGNGECVRGDDESDFDACTRDERAAAYGRATIARADG